MVLANCLHAGVPVIIERYSIAFLVPVNIQSETYTLAPRTWTHRYRKPIRLYTAKDTEKDTGKEAVLRTHVCLTPPV